MSSDLPISKVSSPAAALAGSPKVREPRWGSQDLDLGFPLCGAKRECPNEGSWGYIKTNFSSCRDILGWQMGHHIPDRTLQISCFSWDPCLEENPSWVLNGQQLLFSLKKSQKRMKICSQLFQIPIERGHQTEENLGQLVDISPPPPLARLACFAEDPLVAVGEGIFEAIRNRQRWVWIFLFFLFFLLKAIGVLTSNKEGTIICEIEGRVLGDMQFGVLVEVLFCELVLRA